MTPIVTLRTVIIAHLLGIVDHTVFGSIVMSTTVELVMVVAIHLMVSQDVNQILLVKKIVF